MGHSIWFVISRGSLAGLVIFAFGCQTANRGLAAKNAPPTSSEVKTVDACQRMQNRRSDCADVVGCIWDNDTGQCTAH